MLAGETILCFSHTSWFSLWRNRQQIMSRLARHNNVLFVEPQRDYEFSFRDNLSRNIGNLFQTSTRRVADGLTVISVPPAIPFGTSLLGNALLRQIIPRIVSANNAILVRSIRKALGTLGVEKPVLWLYSPFHLELLGRFGEKLSCYHVYDEIAEYPFNRRIGDIIRGYDEQLSRRVDLVFASSQTQATRRVPFNPATVFIPNGVDFRHFSRAVDPDLAIPEDIAAIPRPIVGFVGFIGFHIDLALLDYLAERRTDWSIVLIGPTDLKPSAVLSRLQRRSNVHFLGKRELDALPGYLKALDVALLPYDTSTHMMHAYPLKLNEYLAAGRPVVATAISELRAFQEVVYTAQTPGDFVARVEDALRDRGSDGLIERRLAIARGNDWDRRVDEISRLISLRLHAEKNIENLERERIGVGKNSSS